MRSSNLSPDDSDSGSSYLLLGLVDKSYTLSEVELSLSRGVASFDLDEGNVRVRGSLSTLV